VTDPVKTTHEALLSALRRVESAAVQAARRDSELEADVGRLVDMAARRGHMLSDGLTAEQRQVRSLGLFRYASEVPILLDDQELMSCIKEAESLWKTTIVDGEDS